MYTAWGRREYLGDQQLPWWWHGDDDNTDDTFTKLFCTHLSNNS